MVDPKELEAAIRPDTILASIMFANNEIGTIEPVAELGEVCRKHGVLFHTDGVQATGHIKIDVKDLPIDMMTMAAHKMYGPKGVGALYVRKGIKLIPVIHGGGQEFGVRSGTENTPGLVGFGMAAELAANRLASGEIDNEMRLRDKLIDGLMERIPRQHLRQVCRGRGYAPPYGRSRYRGIKRIGLHLGKPGTKLCPAFTWT